ncbi:uncharacterized protein BJ171DRAFT_209245 [Polychytrium aggregatum]|uniref:uncharacterized protein n=1 Tax=Polychytrium aggregatum TaxID=110093 RepID=UPI0022FF4498|nr:uncharacterized protein BJ171DRAFT_209245 [Polychytrium aggregatum]KAI9208530.1 hypothetical protein BJ171DRAFT_209245 [Polychytrium aggregatum]
MRRCFVFLHGFFISSFFFLGACWGVGDKWIDHSSPVHLQSIGVLQRSRDLIEWSGHEGGRYQLRAVASGRAGRGRSGMERGGVERGGVDPPWVWERRGM